MSISKAPQLCHCEERSDAAIRISCPFCFIELPARDCHGLQSKPRNDKTGDFSRDRVRRQCLLHSHRRRSFTDVAYTLRAHRPFADSPVLIRRAGCPHPAATSTLAVSMSRPCGYRIPLAGRCDAVHHKRFSIVPAHGGMRASRPTQNFGLVRGAVVL